MLLRKAWSWFEQDIHDIHHAMKPMTQWPFPTPSAWFHSPLAADIRHQVSGWHSPWPRSPHHPMAAGCSPHASFKMIKWFAKPAGSCSLWSTKWNSNQIQPAGYRLYNTTALPPCNVFGNGNSSKEVVTRDHHHANARSTGGNHWIRNAITWVLNGSECLWFIWFWFDSAWVSNLRIWTRYDVVSENASPVVGALTCPYHPLSSLAGRALWAGWLRPWHFGIFSLNWSTPKSCERVIGGYVFRSSDFWRTPRNLSDPRSRSLATGTRDLAWSCHVTFRINRCHKANQTQLLAAGLELLVRGDLRTAFAETVCLAKWRWSDKHLETQHTESQKAHRNPF